MINATLATAVYSGLAFGARYLIRGIATSGLMAKRNDANSYQVAVETLNTLQTNYKLKPDTQTDINTARNSFTYGEEKLKGTVHFMTRLGLEAGDLDVLNPIHIAGTKGKGSVCTMCESILRSNGYKTGFFSSPHLLEVRERIRINGRPISKELFVKYFWEVYNKLLETAATEEDSEYGRLPPYFSFLFLMSYKVFLEEKIDVAIIEVGIGGSYDRTNILKHPKVCGITSLGYDHTELLGNTLKEIAWHKSGIFKSGVPAVTAPQPTEGLEMIRERGKELGLSSLLVSPQYTSYPNYTTNLGIKGHHQFDNASLAVQLCKTWLDQMEHENIDPQHSILQHQRGDAGVKQVQCGIPVAEPFPLSASFIKGLEECRWPGRCQLILKEGVSYFLDCAHTNKSIQYSVEWFLQESTIDKEKNKDTNTVRVMVFNYSGCRDVAFLMKPLMPVEFEYSIFCPNKIDVDNKSSSSDQTNFKLKPHELLPRSRENALLWKRLHESGDSAIPPLASEPLVFESISNAVQWIQRLQSSDTHVQVLVCGSVFLVSGVLACLKYDTDKLLLK